MNVLTTITQYDPVSLGSPTSPENNDEDYFNTGGGEGEACLGEIPSDASENASYGSPFGACSPFSPSSSEKKKRLARMDQHFTTWASSFKNGQFTSVNLPLAKLMFYLQCVCQTTGDFELKLLKSKAASSTSKLSDYTQSTCLTSEEMDAMLLMCFRLSPSLLNQRCLFRVSPETVGDAGYAVWDLSRMQDPEFDFLRAPEEWNFEMGPTTVTTKKFLTFSREWLYFFYIEPMTKLRTRLASILTNVTGSGRIFGHLRFTRAVQNVVKKAEKVD